MREIERLSLSGLGSGPTGARLSIGARCSLRGRKKYPRRVETRGASRLCSRHASRIENNYRNVISRLSSPNANKSQRVYAYAIVHTFFSLSLRARACVSVCVCVCVCVYVCVCVSAIVLNPGLHAHAGLSKQSASACLLLSFIVYPKCKAFPSNR